MNKWLGDSGLKLFAMVVKVNAFSLWPRCHGFNSCWHLLIRKCSKSFLVESLNMVPVMEMMETLATKNFQLAKICVKLP